MNRKRRVPAATAKTLSALFLALSVIFGLGYLSCERRILYSIDDVFFHKGMSEEDVNKNLQKLGKMGHFVEFYTSESNSDIQDSRRQISAYIKLNQQERGREHVFEFNKHRLLQDLFIITGY